MLNNIKKNLVIVLFVFLPLLLISISKKILASDLILSGTPSDPNTQASFMISIYNAPNEIITFGFDINYDPNALDIYDPNFVQYIVKGDLISNFLCEYNPISNGRIKIGGLIIPPITEDKKIKKGANGVVLTITFAVKKNYKETDIFLDNLVDDLDGWTTETTFIHGNILAQDAESSLCFLDCMN